MSGVPPRNTLDAKHASTDATLVADPDDMTQAASDESLDETLAANEASLGETQAASDASLGKTLATSLPHSSEDELAVTTEAMDRYTFPAGRDQAEIGRGGIGRVLVALDTHVGREIAIKELLPSAALGRSGSGEVTSPVAARFLREARVTGQLEHPNIVPVYELGRRVDDTLYYAMKLVRGRTLSQALNRGGDLSSRLALLSHYTDLCQAIAYAHSRGVIHRDIKTENVMLGEFGETVVLDWGLAKVRGQDDPQERELRREIKLHQQTEAHQTLAGATMGTPAYMSPEQARGALEEVDEQSDVWSLGAVLYELLTGRPPHTGRDVREVLRKVEHQRVTPVREREPEVPAELAAVAEKALRRDRSARYTSARELAREIEAYQSGARVSSYRYSSWELLGRFIARNKALSASALALLMILAGSTVAIYAAYRRAQRARGGETRARKIAEGAGLAERRARLRAQSRERDAHQNLSVAYQEKADRLLAAHNYTAARIFAAAALLHNPGNPLGPHSARGRSLKNATEAQNGLVAAQSALFTARMFQTLRFERRIRAHTSKIWSVAFFPDGTRVASASQDNTVRLFRVSDGAPLGVLRGSPTPVYRVAISPDGTRVAGACGDGMVRLWDPRTQRLVATLKGHTQSVRGLCFSPDGATLASSGLDSTARVWDVSSGRERFRLRHANPRVWDVAFSPDGKQIATTAFHGGPTRVLVWDVASRQQVANMTGHLGPAWSIAWSPDGRELASSGLDKTVRVWSIAQKRQRVRLLHHQSDVAQVAYSPRGPFLASTGVDRSVALWLLPTQSVIASHRAHRNHIWTLAFSPAGERLVTGSWDGDLRLFSVRPHAQARLLVSADRAPAMSIRFIPGGKGLLAIVGKEVRIMGVDSGRIEGRLRGHTKEVRWMEVSRDGRWVATAGRDGTARLWDLASRRARVVLRDHGKRVEVVAFTPNGNLLATGGSDRLIRLWHVPSGRPAGVLSGHRHNIYGLAVSADGKRLVSTSSKETIRLWSLPQGKPLRTIRGVVGGATRVAFARGGRWVLAAVGSDLVLWDSDTGKRLRTLRGHDSEIVRLRVTEDQRYAITSGRDNRVFVWDLRTQRPVQYTRFDMLPTAIDLRADHRRFAVSTGAPIHVLPFEPTLWRQDPGQLLKRSQRAADLRLERFRLVPTP